jgi:hypothetical protein
VGADETLAARIIVIGLKSTCQRSALRRLQRLAESWIKTPPDEGAG